MDVTWNPACISINMHHWLCRQVITPPPQERPMRNKFLFPWWPLHEYVACHVYISWHKCDKVIRLQKHRKHKECWKETWQVSYIHNISALFYKPELFVCDTKLHHVAGQCGWLNNCVSISISQNTGNNRHGGSVGSNREHMSHQRRAFWACVKTEFMIPSIISHIPLLSLIETFSGMLPVVVGKPETLGVLPVTLPTNISSH